jgi:uncharacterized protein YlaN (UPF0358 family)
MSNLTSPQPPQHFLQLVRRLYDKRDEVLESSNKIVDYAQKLDACDDSETKVLLSKIRKEMNRIIAGVHELSPHLKNSQISEHISKQARIIGLEMEELSGKPNMLTGVFKRKVAMMLRNGICQDANRTQLRPTPKSIRQAFGITVSARDIRLLFEHQQDNY